MGVGEDCEVVGALSNLIAVIVSQCISILNHNIVFTCKKSHIQPKYVPFLFLNHT